MCGDPDAIEEKSESPRRAVPLVEVVYSELRGLAASYMRGQKGSHTLQPTALVHEAFLKLAKVDPRSFTDRAHFLAVAATAMRQVLVNHAEARAALKRNGGRTAAELGDGVAAPDLGLAEIDVLIVEEALRRLEALDPRKARVVEAKIYGGLTHEEIATVIGVSLTTVEGDWRMARAWLAKELRAGGAGGA
ncbi:MAG: sigma-70 family RNA polymerase sigma factor [Phycisphaera sp.]|nr:sigma-70 family RNA polymerase sigma factor [Phycisphaera sp.]